MGLTTIFGDSTATNEQKNARIGRILRMEDVENVSARLRSLTTSIKLSDDYQAYILNVSVRGVKDYLQKYVEQTGDHDMTGLKVDPQELHNAIMVHAADINIPVLEVGRELSQYVPKTAITRENDQPGNLGYHETRHSSVTGLWHFSIGVDQSQDAAEIIDTVAHETAHHIEYKLGLLSKWDESAVPKIFKTDAAYFQSLADEGAYVSGKFDHSLYEGQANERMARDAGDAAKVTFKNLLPKRPSSKSPF